MAKVCAGRALTGTRQQQCQKRSSDIVSTMTVSDVDNRDIIIVYDVADKESFINVKVWMAEINKHNPDGANKLLDEKKCDLTSQKAACTDEGKELAVSLNMSLRDERQECTQR